jgi:hypothetical protein
MRNSCLILLLALAASAQTPGEIKPAAVRGVVTNTLTGEPVVRAHVSLRASGPVAANTLPQNYGALTDAEGKFKVTGMAPGGYALAVEKTGFLMAAENVIGGRGTFVTLTPGDDKSDLKLKLVPSGAITGRVLDSDGEPVEGATISATAGAMSGGGGRNTDEQGRFRVGGLAAGKYRLCAAPQNLPLPPEIRTDGTKESHYSATCYPNVLAGKAQASVEVRAGADSSGMDIRLIETPIVRVSGKVSGLPAGARTSVIARQSQGMSSRGASVKPDGTYEVFGMDPGRYTVRAITSPSGSGALDSQSLPRSAPVEIDVDATNLDHVDLTLMAPFDISGQVEYEEEEARPQQQRPQQQGAQAQPAARVAPARQVMLTNFDGEMSARPVSIAEDGSFKLEKIPPDRYQVRLSLQNVYIKSMRLGPVAIDGAVLDVRTGAAGMPLSIQVSSALAEVSGRIADDPAATAEKYAALISQEPGLTAPRLSRAPDGSYSFKVPPGKYLLLLIDESERIPMAQMRGRGLEIYADRAEKLDLKPRDKIVKDLK